MAKKILIGLVVIVGALAALVAMQPSHFKIERSATIDARADVVYAQVVDFSKWPAWSPWEKLDPQSKKTFEGTTGQAGASYHWVGNDQVGEGKMTLAEVKPSESIHIKLEFIKPMASVNDTRFTFAEQEGKTKVTWSMEGENGFMGKAFSLAMNMDKMVGGSFEEGLAAMKTVSEAEAKSLAEKAAAEAAAAAAAAPATDAALVDPANAEAAPAVP